jgi:ankyrin repeat protein/Ca2+-binding EF-hand superfamily protein
MEALLDAIEDKLPKKVEQIIASGTVNINNCDSDGYTPLILACTVGHHDIVEFLLDAKAEVDFTAPDGASALFCAVQENHWEVVELLIERKCNVNLQSDAGATPLYVAAQEGFKAMVKKLLESGAKPNTRAHGVSPLFIACQERHVSCVKELLNGKADPNQKNKSGGLPLIVSCFKGHTPVVKELMKCADLDVNRCAAGISPLMTAAKMKHTETIAELLKHKDLDVNLRSKNQERNNAAHFAALAGSVEVLDQLKAGKVDVAQENTAGETPADLILAKHNIKWAGGPRGSGAPSKDAAPGESKGDDDEDEDGGGGGNNNKDKGKKNSKKSSKKDSKRSKRASKKEAEKAEKLKADQATAALVEQLFVKFDFDHNGVLDTPEFMSCLIQLGFKNLFPGDQFKHKVRECFQRFDKDGSGGIDRNEFAMFYNWLKEEHGVTVDLGGNSDAAGSAAAVVPAANGKKLKKQKSPKDNGASGNAGAGKDPNVDTFVLTRDSKVDFGVNFKVKTFGADAEAMHPLLKPDTEYLVVRNLRNMPDGTLGPATLQGIEEEDILLKLDGTPVSTFADFAARTRNKKDIKVELLRLSGGGMHGHKQSANWHKAQNVGHVAGSFHGKADAGFLPSIGGR